MMSEMVHVVVIGGGYAGVMSANRLAGNGEGRGVKVTLVDFAAQFTERIRLHQVGTGVRETASVDWSELLNRQIRHLQARAVSIETEEQVVSLADREQIRFDWLVYAVGSGEPTTSMLSVTNPATARATREAIADAAQESTVTVAGAGPTGVEMACTIATARPDLTVTIVAPMGLAHPVTGRPAVTRRLKDLNVGVKNGVVDPGTGTITSDGKVHPAADATVWTAGLAVPSLAADSGLPVSDDGRLLVDETLTVPGQERVVGAGDAVAVIGSAGKHLRASCATAIPLGAHAADTVLARIGGAEPTAIDIGYLVQCLDLGDGHGHAQFVRPDDTARRWALTGRIGGWTKEQVCRMTVSWLTKEARKPGSYTWSSGPVVSVA